MTLRHRLNLFVLVALAGACANHAQDAEARAHQPALPDDGAEAEAARAEAEQRASRPAIALSRSLHTATMTEAVLDPTGQAALTLDAEGGVRLWTDLHAERVELPLRLPVEEPAWMSVARDGKDFVVAFIDTAGGAVIGRVHAGPEAIRFVPTLEVPPTDPMFELHVLDGGRRILGLSVDHRMFLFDADGRTVATLDEPGFVPWQLRVAQTPGAPAKVVAVLAGPVRVQPIAVTDDGLARTGEARTVALDRGPNRNDLTLSADGTTVLALQRPKARSRRFEIELVDLKSGTRRILAAETDAKFRPRLHAIDDARVLLESGSGQGLWIDASAATAWPPVEGTPDREALPLVAVRTEALAGSTETTRMHASVVAGTRVVPSDAGLVVDRIGGPARRLAARSFTPVAVALDARGTRVAWGGGAKVWIEPVDGSAEPTAVSGPGEATTFVAFVGDEHLLAMDGRGETTLRRIADGDLVSTTKVDVGWGVAASAWRTTDGSRGELVVSTLEPKDPLHVLAVTAGGITAPPQRIPRARQAEYPEAGKPRNLGSRDWIAQLGLDADAMGLRPAKVVVTEPDPTGARIAIALETRHREGFDSVADRWFVGPHDYLVQVYDRATQRRRFSVLAPALSDLAWSADGRRVAVAGEHGGMVLDADDGETVYERHDLGLAVGPAQ